MNLSLFKPVTIADVLFLEDYVGRHCRVEKARLSERIMAADVFVVALDNVCGLRDQIVGLCAIKNPSETYISRLFAGHDRPPGIHKEFGWAYVSPPHRNKSVCKSMAPLALSRVSAPIVATTRVNNTPMISVLQSNGFELLFKYGNGSMSLYKRT